MLEITIKGSELWDESTEQFVHVDGCTLKLEHSLLSISKWESKWKKPFLTDSKKYEKTQEETLDYIRCMTVYPKVDPSVYLGLTEQNIKEITDYISDPMTATTFRKTNDPPSREIITSELIYYWMVALKIPFECEKWNLNRLLTLIRICGIKNRPPKKISRGAAVKHHAAINKARRAKYSKHH